MMSTIPAEWAGLVAVSCVGLMIVTAVAAVPPNLTTVAPGMKSVPLMVTTVPPAGDPEPGLATFLQDTSLSGDATEEEIAFLKRLKFKGKRPTPLYYYRELQNLRDPLHFRTP